MKKYTCIVWLLMLAGITIAQAGNEPVLERKVSISVNRVALGGVLTQLSTLAQVKFMYSSDQLDVSQRVSLEIKNLSLKSALDELLQPLGIAYKVHERESAITLRRLRPQQTFEDVPVPNDRQLITGRVTDAMQQPMAGVSVLIKGTSRGTTTDATGSFTAEVEPTDVLVFSFIGYVTAEVTVGTQTSLTLVLEEAVNKLTEVLINAGYWSVRDQDRTGNISRVTAADLEKQPVSNPLLALQGRMPGVVITQTSGVPGSGVRLQIRGQNSLRNSTADNGNYPLYVIDGVPVESKPVESNGMLLNAGGIDPLNTINPSNIESIEILKDADVTAVYGSRGANGVVLITTKKGKPGGTRVDMNVYAGSGRASNMIDMMNTRQYLSMRREAFANDGTTPKVSDRDLNGTWDTTRNTNWQKELFGRTASFLDAQAAVSGGSAQTSFRLGGGVHRETTVFPGDFGYRKLNGNLSLNHSSSDKKFTLGVSLNYGADRNRLFSGAVVRDALTLPPVAPGYTEHGKPDWTGYTSDMRNPYAMFHVSHLSKTAALVTNTTIAYEVIDGLKILANLGYTDTRTDQQINTPQDAMNPNDLSESTSEVRETTSRGWIAEPQLMYSKSFGGGKLDVLAGVTLQANTSHVLGITGQGFASDALLGNMRAASQTTIGQDDDTEYRYSAVFGRIGYIYKERYLLNLTARRDGSSRFGQDNQFGNFGAVGAGWIFTQENFMREHVPWLSFGKLRASYGTTGNDRIGDYGYLSSYSPYAFTYAGTPVMYTTSLSNPAFGWEVNRKLEAAVEAGALRDRIQLTISWYRNRSSNQLVGYPLPRTTGFASVQYNLDATVENTGWELTLRSVNVESDHVRWTTAFNLTVPKNELVSYPGLETSSYATQYEVGKPLTIRKLYHSLGVNPVTGLYDVADVDSSGTFNQADRTRIANMGRKFFGGIQNSITYKAFTLDFFVEFVKQKSSDYLSLFSSAPGRMVNQPTLILDQDRWKAEGDETELQRFTQSSNTRYLRQVSSDANEVNASFVRLKTISLAYAFPSTLLEKVKLREARLYVQGQNLFTITKYPGLNPELPTLELPPLRIVTAGIQLTL